MSLNIITTIYNLIRSYFYDQINFTEEELKNLYEFKYTDGYIDKIPLPIINVINLQELYLYNNKLTSLSGIGNLVNLKLFDCSSNRLTIIPPEIGNLINLEKFYCYDNLLTNIPLEIFRLINLIKFYCSNNRITIIPPEIGELNRLETFFCHNNNITVIPQEICNLHNLLFFECYNNPIEHMSPNIIRFLNNYGQKLYADSQSVHNHCIQKCIKNSIKNILNHKPIITNHIDYILSDTILESFTKESLIEYSKDLTIHSELNITFNELLLYVINRIEINDNRDEIKNILNQEMKDAFCKCFTGKISRLVNCLNRFDPEVIINISDTEQITNIIILTKEQLGINYSLDEHKRLVIISLKERNFSDDVIEYWINFIE